jgi:hypothetical protein
MTSSTMTMTKFGLNVLFTWHGLLPILVTFLVLEMLPIPAMLGVGITFAVFVSLKALKFKLEFAEESARKMAKDKRRSSR